MDRFQNERLYSSRRGNLVYHRTMGYEEADEEPEVKTDKFTFVVAWILYTTFGIMLTIGGIFWVRSELIDFFDISYAEYGMFLIVIFLVSKLWALFIQIPSIKGYDEIVVPRANVFRIVFGIIILILFIGLTIAFFVDPLDFRLLLAKGVYKLSSFSQNNYSERIAMIDEVIDRGETSAEQFAERGRLYLESARIMEEGAEEYKYFLPDKTSEECYKIAINNFDDAIDQDSEVAEYYYLRGKAEYHDKISKYLTAKDDFIKAIELDDTVPDYYYYCAMALHGIGIYSNDIDSNDTIQDALDYIDYAIEIYRKQEGNPDDNSKDGLESDTEMYTDKSGADEKNIVNQDETLAEYYYHAGLINNSLDCDENKQSAIRNCRYATIYNSGNAEYFSQLGIAYYNAQDDLARAEEAFAQAVMLDKADADYYNEGYHLAWKAHIIAIDKTRVDEAIKVYEESLKVRTDYNYSYQKLAELYKANYDMASAEDVYSRAIKNCPEKAEFYYERGLLYYDQGSYKSAITDMGKAMEYDNRYTVDACYYIGSSYHCLGDYNEAYKYYKHAKENGSNRSDIDGYMDTCYEYMDTNE